MQDHKYILERYKGKSSRFKCPGCGSRYTFTRYIDKSTGNQISEDVGRCDRENSCGYHVTPRQFFAENRDYKHSKTGIHITDQGPLKIDFLPDGYIDISRNENFLDQNNFYQFLKSLFTDLIALDLFNIYCLGTAAIWRGAVLFPQIDIEGNLRQLKAMLHNPVTGKRIKSGTEVEKWDKQTNCYIKVPDEDCSKVCGRVIDAYTQTLNLEQCFFGEHLLSIHPDRPVCIVESEKTAIVSSVYMPGFVWMATGGASGCKWRDYAVYKSLQGRTVTFFPDYGFYNKQKQRTCFQEWRERCERIQEALPGTKMRVSNVLEKRLSNQDRRDQDIADILITKQDESFGWALTEHGYPAIWAEQPTQRPTKQ